jgi:hypothetical protein
MTLTTSRTTTTDDNNAQRRRRRQRQRRRFAVKKLIRHTNGKKWDVVSLYNDTNNFLGPANNFESKEEAQEYLQSYKKKLNNNRLDKFRRHKSSISLKVFVVEEDKEIIK